MGTCAIAGRHIRTKRAGWWGQMQPEKLRSGEGSTQYRLNERCNANKHHGQQRKHGKYRTGSLASTNAMSNKVHLPSYTIEEDVDIISL